MSKIINKLHKCNQCGKEHWCPDGCAEHFTEDICVCTTCWRKEIEEKFKL